ncbi:unnamed protein product [Schistosoma margrebowiei]|uniref:Uncharacterized protein n=1 Tax=Schistosoma margrebowiei TaxID=48269 RepID=A0A183MTY4_9TREM|nr:unnamed protein product [Schistosoma margrebowiei]
MDFLNWLSGWKRDSNDDSQLDFSFLFPATIGVGSIVICLVARYRNELFDLKSTMFRNTKDENVSSRRGNSYSNFRKKPKHSNKSESNPTQIRKTEVSQPLVVETLAPVLPVQQTECVSVQPIQIKQETVSEATDGIEAEFFNPIPKKQKKSKRSSKTKDALNHGLNEQTEIDPAWVTVTSKKVKLSGRNTQKKKNVDSEGKRMSNFTFHPIIVVNCLYDLIRWFLFIYIGSITKKLRFSSYLVMLHVYRFTTSSCQMYFLISIFHIANKKQHLWLNRL